MLKHIMEKWDSYLSVLLGVLLVVAVKIAIGAKLLLLFKYYVFAMIAVVVFDTVINFARHESKFWKFAAILSNGIVLVSCAIILERLFSITAGISLTALLPILAAPNFLFYLGIFLAAENALWVFVYDRI